jgi:hypothetical protein
MRGLRGGFVVVAIFCLAPAAAAQQPPDAQQPPAAPRIIEVMPAPERVQLTGIIREQAPGKAVLESGERIYAVVPHQHALAMRFLDARVHVVGTEVAGTNARSELLIHSIDEAVERSAR